MAEEGLRDGDHVLVEPRERVETGQTVVAEVDGCITVKRLFRERDGRLRLQHANPELLPLVLAASDVRVIGAVVGVLRRHGFRHSVGRPPAPRRSLGDAWTLDLALRQIGDALQRADAIAAASRNGARRVRELARSLRGLRNCYLETTTPRLRAALLREATAVMRRLRRFGAKPR